MLKKTPTVELRTQQPPRIGPASLQSHINARFNGYQSQVKYGTTVGDALAEIADDHPDAVPSSTILAAIVHHRCVDLSYPLMADAEIVPVTYEMREGVLVYRRTASLILLEAVRELWGSVEVTIGQALNNGYFWEIPLHKPAKAEGAVRNGSNGGLASQFLPEHRDALDAKMREIVARDLPLYTELVILSEAKRLFAALGDTHKLLLLKTWWEPHVALVYCGESVDIHNYPMASSTGAIKHFALDYEPGGVVLRFPQRRQPQTLPPYQASPKLKQIYTETRQWLRLLGVNTVGQLNELTLGGGVGELIHIAEGLHEKKIAQIADHVCRKDNPVRLVLIAGPSASGKTTFSKRLSLQLRVNGVRPVALSTDNFYVNRVDTPKDRRGEYDFEALEAIDLPLFNEVLAGLLAGERVRTPRFDFNSGERRGPERWPELQLADDQVLIVEGIHGLNPRLTESVTDQQKFRVYVSALTQLSIDDHNRIFTSDTRLLRRIVRDRRYRGYSAAQTIATWPSVRRGEQRWIFPYQEDADALFNSALVYEHSVLRLYAERFLLEVPEDHPSFVTAYRLLRFIEQFVPLFDETIPHTSLLREFIGGSDFSY